MTRVVLTDGHRILRDALAEVMDRATDLAVVGRYGNGKQLLSALAEDAPDVVVLEARLPDGSGLELVADIHREVSDARVVVLTASHSDSNLALALEVGVDGYLYKECSVEELLRAVRGVGRSGFFASPKAAEHMKNMALHAGNGLFTIRELEVLEALRDGLTTDEIAERLYLSASTVRTHLGGIYRKLQARNRVEAIREAQRRGFLNGGEG